MIEKGSKDPTLGPEASRTCSLNISTEYSSIRTGTGRPSALHHSTKTLKSVDEQPRSDTGAVPTGSTANKRDKQEISASQIPGLTGSHNTQTSCKLPAFQQCTKTITIFTETEAKLRVLTPGLYTSNDPRIQSLSQNNKRICLAPSRVGTFGINWHGGSELIP